MYRNVKKLVCRCVSSGLLWLLPVLAQAAPLIDATELKQKLSEEGLVILEIQPFHYYQQAHIPGSVHTDYRHWRETDVKGLGQMLPEAGRLQPLIASLGIDNHSKVVIVPVGRGAGDLAAAARVYWTLYVAGLEKLSILEGGLLGYVEEWGKEALVKGLTEADPRPFELKLRESEILDIDEVSTYVENGYSIVDTRSPQEYIGQIAGSPLERPGALPGAINLPYDSLMNVDQDGLLPGNDLRALFVKQGIPLQGKQLSYCHTGHRTSLVWFVSHELLGNSLARLYDGSTLEWASTPDRPLVIGGTHLAVFD